MNSGWIGPKTVVGPTATGESYFHRSNIFADILDQLSSGNHVLLAAPRRVGKSSLMIYLSENCPENAVCEFMNIQGIKSAAEFYKFFYQQIIKCLSKWERRRAKFNEKLKEIKIEGIGRNGVKLDKAEIDYLQEIYAVLPLLQKNDCKLILCFDELPEVLHNLYKAGKIEEASSILDHLRTWRLDKEIKDNFSLVLAGSIGIHHVVQNIDGRTSDINDLRIVPFEPLNETEAHDYVQWATENATVQYGPESTDYLLSKIQYHLPYFINLMLDRISRDAQKVGNPLITTDHIDKAFDKIIDESHFFEDWKKRLFDYFDEPAALFQNALLTATAHMGSINIRQIFNLAIRFGRETNYMSIVRGLERDGYIVKDGAKYVFISPFIRAFWKKDNPIFDGI